MSEIVFNTDELESTLHSLAENIGMNNEFIQDGAREAMGEWMRENAEYYSSASNFDGTWIPLSPLTIKIRAQRAGLNIPEGDLEEARYGFPLLYASGYLFHSLELGSPGNVFYFTENSVVQGTNVEYAVLQQEGGRAQIGSRQVTIPARPFLVPPQDPSFIGPIMSEAVQNLINSL